MIAQRRVDKCKSGWIVTFLMIVRDGGPSSGYVSTGFFGGKYLVTLRFLVLNIFFRSYFGPCRLTRGDQEGNILHRIQIPNRSNDQSKDRNS